MSADLVHWNFTSAPVLGLVELDAIPLKQATALWRDPNVVENTCSGLYLG
jgi:hypothetical protein